MEGRHARKLSSRKTRAAGNGLGQLVLILGLICFGAALKGNGCFAQEAAVEKSGTAVIAFGGDVMVPLGTNEEETRKFLSGLSPTFKSADAAFVNLEGPIGGDIAEEKHCKSVNCHVLRQSPSIAQALSEIGVKVVSVANNHAGDLGLSGMASTDAALAQAGIIPAGRMDRKPAVIKIGGMSIAFLGFGSFRGIPDTRDLEPALADIREAKASYDVVVVSMHVGCEGEKAGVIPNGHERCFGDDRGDTKRFARAAARAGATIIVGHGPHVPRGVEFQNGVPIFYSLGNLATGAGIRVEGKEALAPVLIVTFHKKRSAKIESMRIVSFKQDREAGPLPDPDDAARKEILALSKALNKNSPTSARQVDRALGTPANENGDDQP
jgi:hypothetical protein